VTGLFLIDRVFEPTNTASFVNLDRDRGSSAGTWGSP